MKNSDVYQYGMDSQIILGTAQTVVFRPDPPFASLRAERFEVRVQGAINVPCADFLYIEAITLNSIPIEWLSINDQQASKLARIREASYDLFTLFKWASTPRIWPSVRIFPGMKGITRVVLRYTGGIAGNGVEGEAVNLCVRFLGPR